MSSRIFFARSILEQRIVSCRKCPRLVEFLASHGQANPGWWCQPVPGFGDPKARLLILGLAPGLRGANRTGRPFTGDAAGVWLYRILHEKGLGNQGESTGREDGLGLNGVYIANAVKCVPPGNKPAPSEIQNCSGHLRAELAELRQARVVLCLGKIAHDAYLAVRRGLDDRVRPASFPFAHAAAHRLPAPPQFLLDCYHPSRQNTNTGRLTWEMWDAVFDQALGLVDRS